MVFKPDFFITVLSQTIYEKHFNFVQANIARGRIYADLYDEITIPMLALLISKIKFGKLTILNYFLFICITFFSFASNFRSRLLMLGVGFIGSAFILFRKKFNTVLLLAITIITIGYFTSNVMLNISKVTFVNRFIDSDKENSNSINSRLTQLDYSLEIAGSSFFGVGLGNYYDNFNINKNNFNLSQSSKYIKLGAEEYVHNIFGIILAESGYFGLVIFIALLLEYILYDIKILKKGPDHLKAIIFSFWSLFTYSLFNPPVPGSFQVLFWGLRGLLL